MVDLLDRLRAEEAQHLDEAAVAVDFPPEVWASMTSAQQDALLAYQSRLMDRSHAAGVASGLQRARILIERAAEQTPGQERGPRLRDLGDGSKALAAFYGGDYGPWAAKREENR